MSARRLDFYFDFISPYAYLGWCAVRPLAARRDLPLSLQPVLFAGLLSHWGQLGPAEIAPKRAFTFKDIVRRAHELEVPIGPPASHPFNPLVALRASQPEVAGEQQAAVVDACFRAAWVDGVDVTSKDALAAGLTAAGLDGAALVARTAEPEVKEALKQRTAAAIERGVFGVPTVIVEDELFFGQDRLRDVERYLDGDDPAAGGGADAMLAVRPSAQRKR